MAKLRFGSEGQRLFARAFRLFKIVYLEMTCPIKLLIFFLGQSLMTCEYRILSTGADVMLPVVHLIPRPSLLQSNGVPYQTNHCATISFDEETGWIVETPSTSSHVGYLDLLARPERRLTIPSDGGSFSLGLEDEQHSWPGNYCK